MSALDLLEALKALRAEARAILALERAGIAELVSETNVRCLEYRIARADEIIAQEEAK